MAADVGADDASELDQRAAAFLRSAWKSSPGIVASLLFHGAILCVLPFIIFADKIRELAGIPITIGVSARRLDPERPYKPVSSAPPSLDGEGAEERAYRFPDARPAERNESPSEKTGNDRIDGDGRLVLEHMTNDALAGGFRGRLGSGLPGTNDVMGVGGGSGNGGAHRAAGTGGALGRQALVTRGGGSAVTEAAVAAGLSWLARHQQSDGSFRAKTTCGKCPAEDMPTPDVAATALAAVAFMTAGYGPESRLETKDPVTGNTLRFGDTVKGALNYLRSRRTSSGCITASSGNDSVYEHAFATMALCEACRRVRSPELREAATHAVDHLLHRQNPSWAWQYGVRDGSNDTSVTGACVQALRAAQLAGIEVPKRSLADVQRFMDLVSDKDGSTGYTHRNDSTSATTAIGIYVRHFLRPGKADPISALGAKRVAEAVGKAQTEPDAYFWYYAMLGLFEHEGPKGPSWKAVNEAVTTALVTRQNRAPGCVMGSWNPDGDRSFSGQGRAFMTAVSVLTLEVYYRYVDVTPSVDASAEPCATQAPR
jgi:hypothetical protein